MAIPGTKAQLQPMPEGKRLQVATVVSLAVHAVIVLLVGLWSMHPPAMVEALEPIEVSVEPVRTVAAPKPAPPKPPEVRVEPRPEPKPKPMIAPKRSMMPGGGSPKGVAKRNPSPLKAVKPSSQPASNAGGKLKAAPAPPKVLTSKQGTAPSGPVGKGGAPDGPGGQKEVAGEGPSYGPGVGGGPEPIYPKNALDEGLEGTVTLTVAVSATGAVESVSVASGSGHDVLDRAAVRAVKRWSFSAGMAKGKPAAGKVTVIFRFSGGAVKRG